jgi:hypothetical protein
VQGLNSASVTPSRYHSGNALVDQLNGTAMGGHRPSRGSELLGCRSYINQEDRVGENAPGVVISPLPFLTPYAGLNLGVYPVTWAGCLSLSCVMLLGWFCNGSVAFFSLM